MSSDNAMTRIELFEHIVYAENSHVEFKRDRKMKFTGSD
jgi:hypothetical protein